MKWAGHAIKFEYSSANGKTYHITKTFYVKTRIYENVQTSFAQSASWDYPEKYDVSSNFPAQFKQYDTNKYPIIHIQLDAQFFGDADKEEKPKSLYVTL